MSHASSFVGDSRVVGLLEALVAEFRSLRAILESRVADLGVPSNGASVDTTTKATPETEPLLAIPDVCKLLQISPRTLQRLRHLGEVPNPIELGGTLRWRPKDFDRWLERKARK